MKIAFVGPPAVGKDVVSDFIAKKYSLTHISSGDLVREYVIKNNLGDLSRENLGLVANQMRKEFGADILVKTAIERAPDNLVLTGLRAIDEVEAFKNLGGKVISITAPIRKRFELALARMRIDDNVPFDEFKKIEEREFKNMDRNSQNVQKVLEMADYEIVNDGTLNDLFEKSLNVILKL